MRSAVRFLLGDRQIELTDVGPTETVLDWLRLEAGRPGTKEGCAEGDCGACTVVIARLDGDGGLDHVAVNACIQFVGSLDGTQLLTVEDLSPPGGPLHPVQQAMVDHHGSQCGFCTPGFVMSLFAATKRGPRDREGLKRALAGNLCRCTGYGPILTAGEAVMEMAFESGGDRETAERLGALADDETLAFERGGQRYFAPATLDELDRLTAEMPEARIIAGLTDVGLWVTKQGRELETVIQLGRVREIGAIEEDEEALTIGAAATISAAEPQLAAIAPDLGELVRRFASEQIRNVATVCGNIANGSPIGDLPPALIALGAEIVLRKSGTRRQMPLEEFFIEYGRQDRSPGEIVECVRIPKPAGARFRCYKISKRFEQDISAVMAAFAVTHADRGIANARLAFGGMAGVPKRAGAAEAALVGKPFTEANVRTAMAALAEDFEPLTDMRASAGYRLKVAQNLLYKFFVEEGAALSETRVLEVAHG